MQARAWRKVVEHIVKRFPEPDGAGITIVDLFGLSPTFLFYARKAVPGARLVALGTPVAYPEGVERVPGTTAQLFADFANRRIGVEKILFFAEIPLDFTDAEFVLRVMGERSVAVLVNRLCPISSKIVSSGVSRKFFVTTKTVKTPLLRRRVYMAEMLYHRVDVRRKIAPEATGADLPLSGYAD